jgi:MoxR-like ATPase
MATTSKELQLKLLCLGQPRLVGAFRKLYPTDPLPSVNVPSYIAKALADGILSGHFTFDDAKDATPIVLTTPAAPAVDNARLDAVASAAGRSEEIALEVRGKLEAVLKTFTSMNVELQARKTVTENSLADMSNRIADIKAKAGEIDTSTVEATLGKLIAKEFEPFKRAVTEAKAEEVIADLSAVHITGQRTALEVFGIDIKDRNGDPVMVDIWNHPAAPAIDRHWVWSEKILRSILTVQGTHDNLFFGGAKGTGKSQTAEQFAAYTGRAYTRFQFTKYTTAMDFMGGKGMTEGSTTFEKGAVLAGLTSPSTVVLLDELSMTDAGELAILNGFLEPNPCISYGNQIHRRAKGVLVFGADNTLTSGDESGMYAGTRRLNTATAERFASVIKFEHMPMDMEVEIVVRRTGCSVKLAKHVVKALNAFRAKVETGDIVDAPSIRQTMYFIKNLRLHTVDDAWAMAIGNRQPVESATAIQAIKTACISTEVIDSCF